MFFVAACHSGRACIASRESYSNFDSMHSTLRTGKSVSRQTLYDNSICFAPTSSSQPGAAGLMRQHMLSTIQTRGFRSQLCVTFSYLRSTVRLYRRMGSLGSGVVDGSNPFAAVDRGSASSFPTQTGPQLPAALGVSMVPRLFIQQVDIGALVVRATVQGYIPGKQVIGWGPYCVHVW